MIPLLLIHEDMRRLAARVVDLGDKINASSDLDEAKRETICGFCFQARDSLDEAIASVEKVLQDSGYQVGGSFKIGDILPGVLNQLLQGRESIPKANRKTDTSPWNSLDPDDQIPVSIPRFVARRLAVVVRLALMSTKGFHPDHAAFLLRALGDAKPVATQAKVSNGNE